MAVFHHLVRLFIGIALLAGASAQAASPSTPAHTLGLRTAPQTLRSSEVTLIWDKPAESPRNRRYVVTRDGQPVVETEKTHATLQGLEADHTYTFTVRALGGPEDPSGTSQSLTVRTRAAEKIVSIVEHGAVGDGRTLDTRTIQSAIDACPPNGIVRIPAGVFLSGALFLKSDMTLEIAKDGVLKGSARPADYTPFIPNRFEGWEMETYASLLNAGRLDRSGPANIRNVSIRGEGTLSGGGAALSDAVRAEFPGVKGLRSRGRLLLFMNAENVEVAGLTLEESPGWTLHYIYSENISLHGLTIRSDVRNGDGIDPDSSKNSFIFNCTFSTGDDCIAIKSGKNPEGNAVNRPTENVRIFDCHFDRGHGISIGSEMSGGVRGVLVEDCVAGNLLHGLQIKGTPARGGFVEDVVVRDCDLRQITIYTALNYNNDGQAAATPPLFSRFRFENIDLTQADPSKPVIVVNGFEAAGHRTRDLVFENLKLPAGARITIDLAESLSFKHVTTPGGQKPAYEITRSANITH